MNRWTARAVLFASAAVLSACFDKTAATNDMDVANAAAAARNDIDNYAADSADSGAVVSDREAATESAGSADGGGIVETPTSLPAPSVSTPGETPTPLASLPESPFTPDSAQGAANVVQTYYALLEARNYRQAWRLWDDDGRASGMTAEAFAASFAKYRVYHASIGAPGRIDAGAGQRHVAVPVRVYGTLKAGNSPFAMAGPVTLHRVGDIDGATAAQRNWRISASGVRPRPGATSPTPTPSPGTAPAIITARYRCTDGTDLVTRFDNDADTATLRIGTVRAVLRDQLPASGIWYRGQGYELRGKGRNADLSRPGKPATACVQR